MIVVLDVSAAVEIILQKEKKQVFFEKYQAAKWVIAPDLYASEITNVFWKYHQANIISHEDCVQFVEDGLNLIDDFFDTKLLWQEALAEGIKNSHPIYDMFYAVLARRNDATLITSDKKLLAICTRLNIDCL